MSIEKHEKLIHGLIFMLNKIINSKRPALVGSCSVSVFVYLTQSSLAPPISQHPYMPTVKKVHVFV